MALKLLNGIAAAIKRIKKMKKRLFLLTLLFLPAIAGAQEKLTVDIRKARLSWTWEKGTGGDVTEFRVKCGPTAGNYTIVHSVVTTTARAVSVLDVVKGSGEYFCVVVALNEIGESGVSNEVNFFAGDIPSNPTDLRLESS